MVGSAHASGPALPRRAHVGAARRSARPAPAGAARSDDRVPQTHSHESADQCSLPGPDSRCLIAGARANAVSLPGKRQFWSYCGLALETRSSADYNFVAGELRRSKKPVLIRGLNQNHNHDLKNIFKAAATTASAFPGPFREFYENLLGKGMKPEMARLTLARKIAAISLIFWKQGQRCDPEQLKPQAA